MRPEHLARDLQKICPCCGQTVSALPLQWRAESKTLIGPSGALCLTRSEAVIFSLLWDAHEIGHSVTRTEMFNELYGLDPAGGPEDDNIISVFLSSLRKRLAPFGIQIVTDWGNGYRLRVEQ